jgi:hypothetical protein
MNKTEIQQLQNTLLAQHATEKLREAACNVIDCDTDDFDDMRDCLSKLDDAVELYQQARAIAKEIRT